MGLVPDTSRATARPDLSGAPGQDWRTLVIGIGAQKSGTTWLAEVLRAHPDVHMGAKELHYWDTIRYPYIRWDGMGAFAAQAPEPRLFGADPFDHEGYLRVLGHGRDGQGVCADISPAYALCTAATFVEMTEVHPDVRFVFLMRDPVDRLWSGVRQRLRPVLTRDPGFDGLGRYFRNACENPHDPDLLRSRYDLTLRNLDRAGIEACVIFFEDLFTPASVRRIADHVGLADLPADTARVSYGGVRTGEVLDPEARSLARRTLAETYDFVLDRFDGQVPAAWRH